MTDAPALRTEGRWARILALCAGGPMTVGRILAAVDTGKHSRTRERRKVITALGALRDRGWMRHDEHGWWTTAAGADALAIANAVRAAEDQAGKAA